MSSDENTYEIVATMQRRAVVVSATALGERHLSNPALGRQEALELAMLAITNPTAVRAANTLVKEGRFPAEVKRPRRRPRRARA